jgi:pimeloyl-ACP methyl ester carboxylesterase
METVISKDGTRIAYDKNGAGPALISVDGALGQRAFKSETSDLGVLPTLTGHFTVISYDRRGRGDSGNTLPFAVDREIEDIEALIDNFGGQAYLFGISSGAALAFEAALKLGDKVKKLALYEPPYNDDPAAKEAWREYRKSLAELLAGGRNGDAVGLFMMLVGMPAEHLPGMRQHPMWPMFEAVAPTLAYDAAEMGETAAVPVEKAANLKIPTLVMDGGASFPFMHPTAVALAGAIPGGRQMTLEGQTHEVSAEVLGPILVDFFKAP